MLHSLDDAIEFARAVDPSLAIAVVDWSAVVALFDEHGLWQREALGAWQRETPDLALADRLTIRYASDAAYRVAGLEPSDGVGAFEIVVRNMMMASAESGARTFEAFRVGSQAVGALGSGLGRFLRLHAPTREGPWAVVLIVQPDDGGAAQQLIRSEARYRAIVEDQTDFIVRYRRDCVRTFVNEAYARFFGGGASDFVGHSFLDHVAEEHRPAVLAKIQRLIELAPASLADEHLSIRHDGVACWTHWVDRAIVDERGRIVELQAVGRDITERKQAEQRLAQAQKMEALGTLAGGLAHDFNNTLTGILGFADLIADAPDDVEGVREWAYGIHEATERASELTRSLLQLSRQGPRRVSSCDAGELLEAAARLLRASTPRRIEVAVAASAMPRFEADGGQLTQALINLGINARDAIVGRGMVELGARVAVEDGRDHVILSVTDDGAGIPEHVRPRLFEPFYTTKPEGKGTGLGLAMVYACAGAHDGRVELDTEVGRGTRFELHFPLIPSEPAVAQQPAAAGETILLIDDDPLILLHCRASLEQAGYAVLTAASTEEALRCFGGRADEIGAVVTDLVVSSSGGRELVHTLRSRRPGLPILLITGGLAEHGSGGGEFAGVLEKPFSSDDLLRSVAAILQGP